MITQIKLENGKLHCFRLTPNQDLKSEVISYCEKNKIKAGCVLSAVGSLTQLRLRLANSVAFLERKEFFEIVSVTGTISIHGCHIHISVADQNGGVIGGHLVDSNLIYTTCEIVLLELKNFEFKREVDSRTKFKELQIHLIKS